ncbi:MAG: lipid-binding protein, partial [Daejeonella sp.]
MLTLIVISFISCEKLPDQEVKYTSTWPVSGEWMSHVYNLDGTLASTSLFAMRTYNTADEASDKVWIRLGTTQA